jgi:hypothetical protein
MATRFGPAQSLAQKLITKNGRLVSYLQASSTPATPGQPWLGNAADTVIASVPAVFTEYSNNELVDTVVQAGDKRLFIAALDLPGVTPKTKDKIRDGSTDWNIVNIKTTQPGNTAETIMFEIQVRA